MTFERTWTIAAGADKCMAVLVEYTPAEGRYAALVRCTAGWMKQGFWGGWERLGQASFSDKYALHSKHDLEALLTRFSDALMSPAMQRVPPAGPYVIELFKSIFGRVGLPIERGARWFETEAAQ